MVVLMKSDGLITYWAWNFNFTPSVALFQIQNGCWSLSVSQRLYLSSQTRWTPCIIHQMNRLSHGMMHVQKKLGRPSWILEKRAKNQFCDFWGVPNVFGFWFLNFQSSLLVVSVVPRTIYMLQLFQEKTLWGWNFALAKITNKMDHMYIIPN